MATSKRFAGVELGGTSWLLAIAVDTPTNIVAQTKIDTTTPKETLDAAVAWLKTQTFDSIGIASFGPIDLNRSSPTYGYITNTPKPDWGNTEIVGVFERAFPGVPIGFETDVNAPALYEVNHGGHGDITSACYITVGTGVGIGVALGGKAVHGHMHPEGGHVFVPRAPADIEAGFEGVCPFHGACVEGMVASPSIAARTGLDRRDVHTLKDDDPIWDTIAHYLAYACMNLTLMVSPEVIVIGGGISKREKLFVLIREKFEKFLNHYVTCPPVESYIRPSFHPDIGLVSSIELARLTLLEQQNHASEHHNGGTDDAAVAASLPLSPSGNQVAATRDAPRLGIDFVRAYAPATSIALLQHVANGDTGSNALYIQQDLSHFGIAGVVWNCARALVHYFQTNKQLLANKRVVELGAGTGAVGLALALLHSGDDHSVDALVLTDLETAVPLTTRNMHATAHEHPRVCAMLAGGAIATQAYCWGDDVANTPLHGFADVAVASDCLYEPSLYGDLLKSLLALTDRSAAKEVDKEPIAPVTFLAYKQRIPERERVFFESAATFFDISVEVVDGLRARRSSATPSIFADWSDDENQRTHALEMTAKVLWREAVDTPVSVEKDDKIHKYKSSTLSPA